MLPLVEERALSRRESSVEMAQMLKRVNRCSCLSRRMSVVLFCLLCFMREWKSTMANSTSPPVTYNVLHLSKERLKFSDNSSVFQQRFGSEEKAARNTSQKVAAQAKILHRNLVSHVSNETREELTHKMIMRDEARVRFIQNQINPKAEKPKPQSTPSQLESFLSSTSSGLSFDTGSYLAALGVGTPPRDMHLIMDTASHITWLQCMPCTSCYKQMDAIFDPKSSSSYKAVGCDDTLCLNLYAVGCVSNKCVYEVDYEDGSHSSGDFATENVVLDAMPGSSDEVVISNVPLGCGRDSKGMYGMAAGILALGPGSRSFPSQVKGGMFSYCFPDRDSDRHSTLIFGEDAIPDHAVGLVKFTPMLLNPRVAIFYYVQVTGISVGGTELPSTAMYLDIDGHGGTILDSGTTVSRLPTSTYIAVRDAFRSVTQHLRAAENFSLFDTCFDFTGLDSVTVPTVTFHFQGGYDMRLPPSNYLMVLDRDDTFCLAFAAIPDGPAVLGNLLQEGYRVVYDYERVQIGFIPEQC